MHHGLRLSVEKQYLIFTSNTTMFRAGRKQLWKQSIGRVIKVRKTKLWIRSRLVTIQLEKMLELKVNGWQIHILK